MAKRRLPRSLIVVLLILASVAAYHLFWPTYSWENYIDLEEVRLVAIVHGRDPYEVGRHNAPRLLRQLVGALNGGPRRMVQTKLDFAEGFIVIYRSHGSPVLIDYGRAEKDGPMLFRDTTTGYYGSRTLYRSGALDRTLQAIRSSKNCVVKRPTIPAPALSRLVLHARGVRKTVRGASPQARPVVSALNHFLSSVDTSFYSLPKDQSFRAFYMGEVNPQTYLTSTTAALLLLNPPLSMHTNMMFWQRDSGPRAEYHEFTTNMILVSDALSIKDSYSREPRRVVGFSSDAKPNRFYLFDADVPRSPEEATETAEKWNRIIRAIEQAVASGSGVSPQAREVKLNR